MLEENKNGYWNQIDKPAQQLSSEYLTLIEQNQAEQIYQDYIERNSRLLPREFVQNHGIHFSLVLRKLSFGADYKSDFVYLSKSSDDWNCVLVEIERPNSRFFKTGSNDFHVDFLHALQQINKWRAWLLDDGHKSTLVDGILGPIRQPLSENPTFVKYILVFGRRQEYSGNNIRRKLIAAQESSDFKIMSFDSLAENLEAKNNLYIGSRKNEYIDILSSDFVNESIFAWMDAEQICISPQLRDNALKNRNSWHHVKSFSGGTKEFVMDYALARVRIRV